MSRVANSPVAVPKGVDINIDGANLSVKGGKGSLDLMLTSGIGVSVAEDVATITYESDDCRAMAGTTRSLLANMVKGVSEGWEKRLLLNGVGYRAAMQGNKLVLSLGFSHPVEMAVPAGLTVAVENNTQINISGADKQLLGQFASEIRSKRPPEPFKGKGVKYAGEHIVRKEGKKK